MLSISVLGSGSSGNSIYIESKHTKIIVDVGFSFIQTSKRLKNINRDIFDLDAVFVTHEHRDHCQGVGVLTNKTNIPVYLNELTYNALPVTIKKTESINFAEPGNALNLKDIEIETFSIPHDAANPVGITIKSNKSKISIVTDLGYVTNLVREKIKDSNLLVIESNHDVEMLKSGPYPWSLKQRVKGKSGHLSNEECSDLVKDVSYSNLKHVILAHLSEKNNHPDIAKITTQEVLLNTDIQLTIASQKSQTDLIGHA